LPEQERRWQQAGAGFALKGASALREFVADLFVSLDGFAAGLNEAPFFGYFSKELGAWILEELDKPQTIILGRVTYEALVQLAPEEQDPIRARMSALPKLVFSSGLQEPLLWKNAQISRAPVAEEIRRLKAQDGGRLRSIGSIRLVHSLMELGLVDRLRLMVFPLVLGSEGREPIFLGFRRTPLALLSSKCLDSRLLLLEYVPAENAGA
jgi:dihydrofolate reductase